MADGKTFAASVDAWVRETEQHMLDVAVTAVQSLVDAAQTPQAKGGRMRVKTGFLRASARGALGSMPEGPNIRPDGASLGQFSYDGQAIAAVLLSLKPGDTFFFGWAANYAEVRNTYDGFLDAEVQKWQQHVDNAVRQVRSVAGD